VSDVRDYYGEEDFIPIVWYTNNPYYFSGSLARKSFYGVSGIPHAFFDGYQDVLGGSGSTMFSAYSPIVASHLSDPSPLAIDAVYRWQDASSGTLFVNVVVEDTIDVGNNVVHFVLCEDGEGDYPNLARAVLADETFSLSAPGESLDIVRTFTLDPAWDKDAMNYVVMVQAQSGTQEVHQATLARLGQGIMVTPDDDLNTEGDPGGPYDPTEIQYTVENVGPTSVNYSVTASEPWITVTDGRGSLSGFEATTVTVELNMLAQALGNGFHSATVSFENTDNHVGDETRLVTVRIGEPSLVYSVDFETNPLWSGQLLWQRGTPTGNGGSNGYPDPTAGHSGTTVYGYNLNGDYENGLGEKYLSSQPFDCSLLNGTTLKFWRWLGVDDPDYDHASVRVSTNFLDWTTVWENAKAVTDSSWTPVELDISAVADGQSTVYMRWVMGTTDGTGRFCGWNIDDVEVYGFGEPESGVESGAPPQVALEVYPNPFNPRTTVRYELPVERHVLLTVHDVSGRLVSTLVDGRRPAGRREARWDGTASDGSDVASGVYFVRYDDGVRRETARMVLLK